MASWIVLQGPDRGPPRPKTELTFVRDGASFLAFVVPPLWLLWHRLWIEAALTIAALAAIAATERQTGLGFAAPLLSLLVSVYVALEGNAMRVAALGRRGWRPLEVVEAEDLDDAETRYAADVDEDGDGVPDRFQIIPSAGPVPPASVGLLLNPGS